jgi:hypothetical protein
MGLTGKHASTKTLKTHLTLETQITVPLSRCSLLGIALHLDFTEHLLMQYSYMLAQPPSNMLITLVRPAIYLPLCVCSCGLVSLPQLQLSAVPYSFFPSSSSSVLLRLHFSLV